MITVECPCGTGERYDVCCGRLHRGAAQAVTAEELMRSRYAAYAVGDLDHVWRTWHPGSRPDTIEPDPALIWSGLEVVDVVDGGPDDERGEVEFVASFTRHGQAGQRRERSVFVRRRGRWVYEWGDTNL